MVKSKYFVSKPHVYLLWKMWYVTSVPWTYYFLENSLFFTVLIFRWRKDVSPKNRIKLTALHGAS